MDRRRHRQIRQARHRPHAPTHALDRFLLQDPSSRCHHLRLRQQPLHRLLPPHHHPVPPTLETERATTPSRATTRTRPSTKIRFTRQRPPTRPHSSTSDTHVPNVRAPVDVAYGSWVPHSPESGGCGFRRSSAQTKTTVAIHSQNGKRPRSLSAPRRRPSVLRQLSTETRSALHSTPQGRTLPPPASQPSHQPPPRRPSRCSAPASCSARMRSRSSRLHP